VTRVLVLALLAAAAGAQMPTKTLSIVLLVDVSASVSDAMAMLVVSRDQAGNLHGVKGPTSPRDLFARAIQEGFIANLSATERVRIGTIARTVQLGPQSSSDRVALRQVAIDALDVPEEARYGPSPLWDAVDAAVTVLEREPGPRAVVLITDGLSTGNRHSLSAVIEHARNAKARVSVIGQWFGVPRPQRFSFRGGVGSSDHTGSAWRSMVWPFGNPPDLNLRRLADSTGGTFITDGAPPAERWGECGMQLRTGVPQCAGEDPTPAAALAKALEHLRTP
jgi:hypothetical protein